VEICAHLLDVDVESGAKLLRQKDSLSVILAREKIVGQLSYPILL
jgi:hypothetical protein